MGERFAPYGPYYQERPDAIFCGIGIHCHEFGHLLGWPDLYYGSGKNGGWDLMANGNYNPVFTSGTNNKWASAPAPPSPYLRYIKSWINFVSINSDITFSADYNMQDPEIFKIVDSSYPDRYFLIENRNFDATMNFNGTSNFDYNHWLPWNHYLTKPDLPTQGLLIWYCNKYSSDGTYPHLIKADGFNNANHPYNSYILNGPKTAGDAGDPFPGFYNVKVISPWSFPTQLDIAPSPSTRQSSNVGCEIIEMGTNYIQVKLFYLNPVNSSPSKPRFLEASSILYPQHGTYITHLTWYSNGEQDLNSYYIL